MKKILTVVGARPQFIKAAPVCFALRDAGIEEVLVHTGQHYDDKMSDIFFREMGIPRPTHNLNVGSGSHGSQTGEILRRIEAVMLADMPDIALVYGDTNSTLAGALAACKLNIPIAHVEAGLRSFNRAMPEEHNRVLADHCSSLLFCPTEAAVRNLAKENICQGVHLVGDTMYDAVLRYLPKAEAESRILKTLGLPSKEYYLATVHRPYNTDDPVSMSRLVDTFGRLDGLVVFPIHPRTLARLQQFGIVMPTNVLVIDPVGYLDMLVLQRYARVILTDSGGVQKEACFVGTPCVTLRPETEWVETVESCWNRLAWGNADTILDAVASARICPALPFRAYGDGNAAETIVRLLAAS